MNILVLQGSLRKDKGIMNIVLNSFLKGIRNKNNIVIHVEHLLDSNIETCKGCLKCWRKKNGCCEINDDMPQLIENFKKADIVIAASPMYIDTMSSAMKKFWERLIPLKTPFYIKGKYKVRHEMRENKSKKMFLISTAGFPELEQFDAVVLTFERIAYNFNMKFLGNLLRPECHSLSYVKKYEKKIDEVLSAIEKCGEELINDLNIKPETLNKAQQPICESIEKFISSNNNMWNKVQSKNS